MFGARRRFYSGSSKFFNDWVNRANDFTRRRGQGQMSGVSNVPLVARAAGPQTNLKPQQLNENPDATQAG
jgi:hypothetical protein